MGLVHYCFTDLFYSTEGTTEVKAPVKSKPSSFLQVCKEFAGKSDEPSYAMKTVTRSKIIFTFSLNL